MAVFCVQKTLFGASKTEETSVEMTVSMTQDFRNLKQEYCQFFFSVYQCYNQHISSATDKEKISEFACQTRRDSLLLQLLEQIFVKHFGDGASTSNN